MTAIVLPEVDRATIDELRKRIPDLSEIELPKLERLGKSADEAVDRWRGRSRPSLWAWVVPAIGLAAIVGAILAFMTWSRRSGGPNGWSSTTTDPWRDEGFGSSGPVGGSSITTEVTGITTDVGTVDLTGSSDEATGLSAAEASLMSNPPGEEGAR